MMRGIINGMETNMDGNGKSNNNKSYRPKNRRRILFYIIAQLPFAFLLIFYIFYAFAYYDYDKTMEEPNIYLNNIYNKLSNNHADIKTITFKDIQFNPANESTDTDGHYTYYAYYLPSMDMYYLKHMIQDDGDAIAVGPYLNVNLAKTYFKDNDCMVLAMSNLDQDAAIDVWCIDFDGEMKHLYNDKWRKKSNK